MSYIYLSSTLYIIAELGMCLAFTIKQARINRDVE